MNSHKPKTASSSSAPPKSLVIPAPAKLNLFLHITGRRSDGYHLLQTAFQLLDYGDTVGHDLVQLVFDIALSLRYRVGFEVKTAIEMGVSLGAGVFLRLPVITKDGGFELVHGNADIRKRRHCLSHQPNCRLRIVPVRPRVKSIA